MTNDTVGTVHGDHNENTPASGSPGTGNGTKPTGEPKGKRAASRGGGVEAMPSTARADAATKVTGKVLRYARRRGWNLSGLPAHGACFDVLARIIALVEANGMRLGRWRTSFIAVYGAFHGRTRPRSFLRHGFFWADMRWNGGVTVESQIWRDLTEYERRLKKLTPEDWGRVRAEARRPGKIGPQG